MRRQDRNNSRRELLKAGAAIGAGAAASALLPGTAVAEVEARPEAAGNKRGYQLTQHVLDYYKSAKL